MKKDIKSTEVKLMLDSTRALSYKFDLTEEIKTYFEVKKPAQRMRIWYLDTEKQQLNNEDWSVRYRYHEHYDFELTYKKRFSLSEYERMLDTDLAKDFAHFQPEIDMGFSKKTYSLSYIKTFAMSDDFENLNVETARHHAIVNAPAVLVDWRKRNQGLARLDHAVIYGPVFAMEHCGRYNGLDVTFEVWKLDGYLTEISFDVKTSKADDLHEQLLYDLQKMRLVLPENTLKTQALFDYYATHNELVTV